MTPQGKNLVSDATPDLKQRRALLLLMTINGMGPKRLRLLLDHFSSATDAINASNQEWLHAGLPKALCQEKDRGDPERVEQMLAWLDDDARRHVLTRNDDAYPQQLNQLPDPPAALFCVGDISLLDQPQLAIVGSRSPTTGGRSNARAFARHLAQQGLIITSGLAQGIDAEAHRGALLASAPTIAVMGTGPDIIYPRHHAELADEIIDGGGLLVTEWPPGTTPRREHFPRRNRLISGLSEGVLVVEAGLQSGSLITARLAAEQGREVFAIPGSIHNPLARGTHRLIREGAKLVESGQDIFEELAPALRSHLMREQKPAAGPVSAPGASDNLNTPVTPLDADQARILDLMGFDPVSADTLIEQSGLTPAEVSSILLMLELSGQAATMPGGLYVRQS